MSQLLQVETKIPDMHGIDHPYTCKPLAFDECLDLGLEIAAVIGGPLGDAFKSLLLGGSVDDMALDQRALTQLVAGMGDVPERLIARGGSRLIARILSSVVRVGSDDRGQVKMAMSDADARTLAYGGGNLMESILAVRWVLGVNYGPFLTALWDVLLEPLQELASPLIQAANEETKRSAQQSEGLKPSEIVSSSSSV